MDYLNRLVQKWMPSERRAAVDSEPRLHGIWDTINSTLATPPASTTRLPAEFYDLKARKIVESVVVEEEYSGYKESLEYRTLGIGNLLGEVVQRMISSVQGTTQLKPSSPVTSRGSDAWSSANKPDEHGDDGLKFALAACHDSTLAAIVASLGAMEGESNTWPSYTSSLAVELFRSSRTDLEQEGGDLPRRKKQGQRSSSSPAPLVGRSIPRVLGFADADLTAPTSSHPSKDPPGNELDTSKPADYPDSYVRIRYNHRPITIPGCKINPQNHLEGDETFCTLVSNVIPRLS